MAETTGNKKGIKRRRLAAPAEVSHEVDASKSLQDSRLLDNSGESAGCPKTVIVAKWELTASPPFSTGSLSAGRDNGSEVSYSVDAGSNRSYSVDVGIHRSYSVHAGSNRSYSVDAGSNRSYSVDASSNRNYSVDTGSNRSYSVDASSNRSYSVDAGSNRRTHTTDVMLGESSSDVIKCYKTEDELLLYAINSESPGKAITLLQTNVPSFTKDGLNQALISACRRGHKLLVQTLVRVGANIEHADENENTPLLICAEQGFTDIVRFLVSRQANVKARNSTGNTALILSVRPAGSTDLTRFLLKQQDVDIHHENQDGDTALTRATRFMDVDTMGLLLENSLARTSDSGNRYVIPRWTQPCFFNCRAQEIKQVEIVARTGLADVYKMLSEHLITGTSALELAIKARDIKSFDIFLDCEWPSSSEKKRFVDRALVDMFPYSRHDIVQRFSDTEVTIVKRLLQHGADVNQGAAGTKLISFAVEAGDFQLVELMCTHGAKLKRYSFSGEQDPLCIAAKNGCLDLIELLLKYGADINWSDFSDSALDYTLRNDHTECAKLLIQLGAKMDVACALRSAVKHQRPNYMCFVFENYKHDIMDYFSQQTLDARDLLISAVEKGNSDIIGQILDAGVDVNKADQHGQTPLMAAKNRAVAEFLIQRGADINQVIEYRNDTETLLSYLIKNRKCVDASTVELCKCFIENGVMVNCRSGEGETPLMMAASQDDCVGMLEMLLDNGADVTDKDIRGNNALLHAIKNGCSKNVSCLLKFTRNSNNEINIQNNEGLTPLIISVMKRNVAIAKEIIEEGADVNIKDNNENTALHHLLITRDSDDWFGIIFQALGRLNMQNGEVILTSLLKAGCHVNCQNSEGLSPLMLAAKMSKPSLISILLDAGADVNAVSKNNHSQTAISFLSETAYLVNENTLCIELLLERGASASYLNHECLQKLIFQDKIHVIPRLIQHGVGPADIETSQMHSQILSFCLRRTLSPLGLPRTLSPLCATLLRGHISLARYFMDILFLTRSDLSMFASNKVMGSLLIQVHQEKSWNFLEELSSQPMTLDKLSLVTVSAAVGSSPGREARVNSLPLPQMMKDRLMFKSTNGKHLVLSEIHTENRATFNRALLVNLLRDRLQILRYVVSDDDDDYNFYASSNSGSDDAIYFLDSD